LELHRNGSLDCNRFNEVEGADENR
jgi:hypothetical protein